MLKMSPRCLLQKVCQAWSTGKTPQGPTQNMLEGVQPSWQSSARGSHRISRREL